MIAIIEESKRAMDKNLKQSKDKDKEKEKDRKHKRNHASTTEDVNFGK